MTIFIHKFQIFRFYAAVNGINSFCENGMFRFAKIVCGKRCIYKQATRRQAHPDCSARVWRAQTPCCQGLLGTSTFNSNGYGKGFRYLSKATIAHTNKQRDHVNKGELFLNSLKQACFESEDGVIRHLVQENMKFISNMNARDVTRFLTYLIWASFLNNDILKAKEYTNLLLTLNPRSTRNLKSALKIVSHYIANGEGEEAEKYVTWFHHNYFVHLSNREKTVSSKFAEERQLSLVEDTAKAWCVEDGERFVMKLAKFEMISSWFESPQRLWRIFINSYLQYRTVDDALKAHYRVYLITRKSFGEMHIILSLIKQNETEKLNKLISDAYTHSRVSQKRKCNLCLLMIFGFSACGKTDRARQIASILREKQNFVQENVDMNEFYYFLLSLKPYDYKAVDSFTEILIEMDHPRVLKYLKKAVEECFKDKDTSTIFLNEFVNYINEQTDKEKPFYVCLMETMEKFNMTKNDIHLFVDRNAHLQSRMSQPY